jgi:hypothetical protein
MLQDIVNEGLASAVRSGDYYTSRQLLILYSLVASEGHQMEVEEKLNENTDADGKNDKLLIRKKSLDSEAMLRQSDTSVTISDENSRLPPLPPPPPLDTDRLRSATNSDGLLAVLGAAQVLKAMRDGSAKIRTEESFLSVEEYVLFTVFIMALNRVNRLLLTSFSLPAGGSSTVNNRWRSDSRRGGISGLLRMICKLHSTKIAASWHSLATRRSRIERILQSSFGKRPRRPISRM